ncbi:hypothetical protein HMPREF0880_01219 [Yokenella regensburgei ATCC 43003]|nr:hypothetical protein HMPREF0880_01219 [Yokenella regensburgei ATCC 43003]
MCEVRHKNAENDAVIAFYGHFMRKIAHPCVSSPIGEEYSGVSCCHTEQKTATGD